MFNFYIPLFYEHTLNLMYYKDLYMFKFLSFTV